jgi:photosystem II stability/assembly factor-like uncharacterized protein
MNLFDPPLRSAIQRILLSSAFLLQSLPGQGWASQIYTESPAAAKRFDSWRVLGPGGGGAQFHPAICPQDPKVILNSTDMSEGYISHDGGDSWRMFNLRGHIRWYVWDPSTKNIAYAKTTGLFRTSDCGSTWKLVHPSPSNIKRIVAIGDHGGEVLFTKDGSQDLVEALAVDPSNSGILFAIMSDGAQCWLSVSNDAGERWKRSASLPTGCRKVWIDPHSPPNDRTVVVAAANTVSVRRAGRWIHHPPVEGVKSFNDISLGFDAQGASALYVVSGTDWRGDNSSIRGIFLSRDYGANWKRLEADFVRQLPPGTGEPNPEYQAIACCETEPGIVYVSYKGARVAPGKKERFLGVARSADFGKTWQLVWLDGAKPGPNMHNDWITERYSPEWGENPFCLAVALTNPEIVLATDFGRTMRTSDGGKNWYGVFSKQLPSGDWTTTGLDMTTCYGIHFDPFDLKHWFISYTDIGLMESLDGGVSWRSVTKGVPEDWVNTAYWMVFDPEVKGRCWAVMSGIHDLPFPKMWRGRGIGHYDGGVVASDDAGRTWRRSSEGMSRTAATDILLDPHSAKSARSFYVAGFGTGVWKSMDDGKTWKLKNNGIRGKEPFCWRIVMDTAGTLYLVVARRSFRGEIGNDEDGFLYRSTDGAETWHEVKLPVGVNGPHGIAIDPRDSHRLYLACWGVYHPEGDKNGGILLSIDGGASWKWIFQRHQHVYDVITDPVNPDVLYAGTMTFSVWRSPDRGLTWMRLKGYNFKQTNRVIVDPFHPDQIFITTFGGSIWHGPATGDPKAKEDVVTPEVSYDIP